MVSKNRQTKGGDNQQSGRISPTTRAVGSVVGLAVLGILSFGLIDHGLYATLPFETPLLISTLIEVLAFQFSLLCLGAAYLWIGPDLEIPFRSPTVPDRKIIVYGLTGAFAVWFISALPTTAVFPAIDFLPSGGNAETGSSGFSHDMLVLLGFLSLIVIAPVEELFYRGILQGRLRTVFHPAIAISFVSVVFAIAHVYTALIPMLAPYPVPFHPVVVGHDITYYTLMGAIFGIAYEYTENLTVPVLIHGLFNAGLYIVILPLL